MVYIYTLTDPLTNLVRYVGKTNDIKKRLILHLSTIDKYKSHKNSWLKSLKNESLVPIIEIVDIVDVNELAECLNIKRSNIYGYISKKLFIGDFRYEFINNSYYNESGNYNNKGSR